MLRTLLALGSSTFILVCCLQLSQAAGSDWPQWRGPNRDAVSTEIGLLQEWPKDGPPMLWRVDGLGAGFSTVAIASGKLFTMGDRADSCFLICLDLRNNGKELWSAKIGRTGGQRNPGPRATPTVDGDLVFALGQWGDIVCVEAGTGKEVWRKNFKRDWGGKEGANWGCSESPLVDGDRVVVTPGGRQATMVALDRKSGKQIWKGLASGSPSAGHSSVVTATVGGVKQYINLTGNSVVAFDAQDGKFLWQYGDDRMHFGRNTANVPTCIVKGEYLFCSAGYDRGGALLRMVPNSSGVQVEEVWFEQKLNNKHGGWVLVDEHLYGDRNETGRPQCAEFKTGKVVWQKDQRTAGAGSASVAYADGRLYIRYMNGVMTLAQASPKGFNEISAFKIPNVSAPSWSHPVVWDGKLFLREQENLYCYDVKQK